MRRFILASFAATLTITPADDDGPQRWAPMP